MRLILGGHWEKAPAGWTALNERDQDITQRLKFQDSSVDVIFTEHVVEHIPFVLAIGFFKESLRVLKPGGILRTVAPMVDALAKFEYGEFGRRYANESLVQYFPSEVAALGKIGLTIQADPHPFLVDSLVRKHGHQFCWSTRLMVEVLKKVGFSDARPASPGVSAFDAGSCQERTIRGTHGDNLIKEFGPVTYDPESGVVEAIK
jgi:SAM-dependent methyltransferase